MIPRNKASDLVRNNLKRHPPGQRTVSLTEITDGNFEEAKRAALRTGLSQAFPAKPIPSISQLRLMNAEDFPGGRTGQTGMEASGEMGIDPEERGQGKKKTKGWKGTRKSLKEFERSRRSRKEAKRDGRKHADDPGAG